MAFLNAYSTLIIILSEIKDLAIKNKKQTYMKRFILYSTEHCHLCEIAESLLVTLLDEALHVVEVEDIADDDLLVARYGIRIPVVIDVASKLELQWPFDAQSLKEFIDG